MILLCVAKPELEKGVKFEGPPRQVPNTRTKVAFLTDPWGTYIEVTEHFAS